MDGESEKASSCENQTQDIWCMPPVLCHWATTTGHQPSQSSVCTAQLGLKSLSCTPAWQTLKTLLCLIASTLWRHVLTRSLVRFDNPGHGCPMAKSSLRCLTLPNKVGVVQGHRTVMYENTCTYALLEMRYYSGTSIIQAPLVPSKVSWVKKCPYFGDFRYISGRHGNAYSCHWVLRTCIPKLSLVVQWQERITRG